MNAREEILQRIRSAAADAPSPPAVPRNYDRTAASGIGDVARFAETVDDYQAQVRTVSAIDVPATIRSLLPADAVVVVPPGLRTQWVGDLDVVEDHGLSVDELDAVDAVLTECRLGVAATGTIVLDGGIGQGRRALTLVPDHHICIVRSDQVVDTIPQAFAALDPSRPLTFVSGPSATSDIELTRVEGVHGPRTLDVIIVEQR